MKIHWRYGNVVIALALVMALCLLHIRIYRSLEGSEAITPAVPAVTTKAVGKAPHKPALHEPMYLHMNGTEHALRPEDRSSHFLNAFKNPCYLSSDEGRVLGPFRSRRIQLVNELRKYRSDAVYVDMDGHKAETLRCLPYYFVLGWPKCGTTEMSTKMHRHPHILHAPLKEPAFFSNRRFGDVRDGYEMPFADDYVDYLNNNTRQMGFHYILHRGQVPLIVGDHSTHTIDQWHAYKNDLNAHYTRDIPESTINATRTYSTPLMVKYIVPHSKLIVMFRDPVDRLYSLYKMHEATSPQDFHQGVVFAIHTWNACVNSNTTFDDCLYIHRTKHETRWGQKAISALPKSLYYYFMKEWLSIFPREQFLFIKFPDFIIDPDKFINEKVFPFLGVKKLAGRQYSRMAASGKQRVVRSRPRADGQIVDASYNQTMLEETRTLLIDFFKPFNKKLSHLLNDDDFNWSHD